MATNRIKTLKSFSQFLKEGGEDAGKYEVAQTSIRRAIRYGQDVTNKNLFSLMPGFKHHFLKAKKQVTKYGVTKRKDMPVVDDNQVDVFVDRLGKGRIDTEHFPPLHFNTKQPGPSVKIMKMKIQAKKLIPIQQQLYLDKTIPNIVKSGMEKTLNFLRSAQLICSNDYRIIDGHHRWLSAMMIDPNMEIPVVMIDIPINKLLDLTREYGDKIGNRRNAFVFRGRNWNK